MSRPLTIDLLAYTSLCTLSTFYIRTPLNLGRDAIVMVWYPDADIRYYFAMRFKKMSPAVI